MEVFGSGDVDEDMAERLDGVCIPSKHHVGKSNVVICGEMGRHDPSKDSLLGELDIIESLQSKSEISEQTVNTEKSDNREVSQHSVKGA